VKGGSLSEGDRPPPRTLLVYQPLTVVERLATLPSQVRPALYLRAAGGEWLLARWQRLRSLLPHCWPKRSQIAARCSHRGSLLASRLAAGGFSRPKALAAGGFSRPVLELETREKRLEP
jgi:hypothetical protein